MTKLDILDILPEIKVCVGYRLNGKDVDYFPSSTSELAKVEVIYEKIEGWQSTTEGVRSLEKLPPNAHKYVRMIEEYLNVPGIKISLYLVVNNEVKENILQRERVFYIIQYTTHTYFY